MSWPTWALGHEGCDLHDYGVSWKPRLQSKISKPYGVQGQRALGVEQETLYAGSAYKNTERGRPDNNPALATFA